MVEVSLRDNNQIINLLVVGKAPIRGRISSSPFFHSPLELLLSALGLCIGGKINDYCRMNDLNPSIFEQILIDYDSLNYIVNIKRPENLSQEHISRLRNEIINCNVARELHKEVKVKFELNTVPVEELIKKPTQRCCGAK